MFWTKDFRFSRAGSKYGVATFLQWLTMVNFSSDLTYLDCSLGLSHEASWWIVMILPFIHVGSVFLINVAWFAYHNPRKLALSETAVSAALGLDSAVRGAEADANTAQAVWRARSKSTSPNHRRVVPKQQRRVPRDAMGIQAQTRSMFWCSGSSFWRDRRGIKPRRQAYFPWLVISPLAMQARE